MKAVIHLSLLLLATACTADFSELNTNENAPTTVQPELLLRQVLYGYGEAMSYEGFVAGNLLSQHFAMIDFNLFDRHALGSPQEGGNPWDILYTQLRDNETVLRQARQLPSQAVYEGPALVMKAYLAMVLTDLYGDVPYRAAFSARSGGSVTPAYDRQEDIYRGEGGILALLEEAVLLLEAYNGTIPLGGDILFNGDLDGWVRLANSLRFKALLRISNRVDVNSELTSLLGAGDLILTPDQDATFAFTDGPPNNFAFATARVGLFNVFLMSTTAERILVEDYDDPRTGVLFRPSAAQGDFRGVANGLAAASAITPDDFARPGTIWREETGRLRFNYFTSWEMQFLIAEAALRGLVPGESRTAYERGVEQAFGYWGVALPDDYLTAGPAAFADDRALEQIITQKWIAGIGHGYEPWIEWRRTGFPELLPVAASLNDGRYPIRMPYPADEQALNLDNYRTAAEATDGNSINVPVWWDVD